MIENELDARNLVLFNEHEEQAAVVAWASNNEWLMPDLALLYAVPNGARLPWRKGKGGKRYSPEAMKLKAEGLKSGVPDLCLPVARGGYHGLYIEMKRGDNKPTENQTKMLDALAAQGYLAVVCYGHNDAIDTLSEYLQLERTKPCLEASS
jgi:hypothetical protein